MTWLHLCQGLIVLGWLLRLIGGVINAVNGKDAVEPSGAFGVLVVLAWMALTAIVIWHAGALSAFVGPR